MKTAFRWTISYLFGDRPRAVAVLIAAYAPNVVRTPLQKRLGVQNRGSIGRRVRFNNAAVSIGRGAHIGNGCRFEGGAVITIADGVTLPPKTIITTVVSLNRSGLRYDRPVSVIGSPDREGLIISGTGEQT